MKKLFKKMKKLNSCRAITVTTLFCFVFTACGGGSEDAVMNFPTQQSPIVAATDPVGTVVLNFKKGTSANEQSVGVGKIYMDNAGNFNFDKGERYLQASPSGSYYAYDNDGIEFSSVGKVDGLSGITTIPSKGWSKKYCYYT